ncbi:hypothetical protein P3T21_005586 [Paraburkholderia sp. GAS334]
MMRAGAVVRKTPEIRFMAAAFAPSPRDPIAFEQLVIDSKREIRQECQVDY